MAIRIIAIGKKHENWVVAGVERYEKRLKKPFDVKWMLMAHSTHDGPRARQNESERILSKLKHDEFVVLLDERGVLSDSPAFSRLLLTPLERSRSVVIIIGGAYGVDVTLHERADVVVSLSRQVFPHQLVRLMLVEQLYRAQEISGSRSYHHE